MVESIGYTAPTPPEDPGPAREIADANVGDAGTAVLNEVEWFTRLVPVVSVTSAYSSAHVRPVSSTVFRPAFPTDEELVVSRRGSDEWISHEADPIIWHNDVKFSILDAIYAIVVAPVGARLVAVVPVRSIPGFAVSQNAYLEIVHVLSNLSGAHFVDGRCSPVIVGDFFDVCTSILFLGVRECRGLLELLVWGG